MDFDLSRKPVELCSVPFSSDDRARAALKSVMRTSGEGMELFEDEEDVSAEGQGRDLAKRFGELVRSINHSSPNAHKNKPLESLVAEYTGWQPVAFKYIAETKNLNNRISEIRNRPDAPRHVVALVPSAILREAIAEAQGLIRERPEFDAIGVATTDTRPPAIRAFVHRTGVRIPESLLSAFPNLLVHEVPGSAPTGASSSRQPPPQHVTHSSYGVGECAAELGVSALLIETWRRRLMRKKQLIFQGPPGTGKTFCAKALARLLTGNRAEAMEIIQFHPTYSYEDFVQGIRASVSESSEVSYQLQPGHFLTFCARARAAPDVPFVLIIDELNRGNLSRIFGELLFLLEYRDEHIALAQGGGQFSVPGNVYIIGTMNTADRSIALVDHALRRRFSVAFLEPDYEHLGRSLLANGLDDAGQLVGVLRQVNQTIEDRHYQLGTSFFLTPGPKLAECIQEVWEGEIEPYLEEFFFDQREKVEKFRWRTLAASALSWWAGAAHA